MPGLDSAVAKLEEKVTRVACLLPLIRAARKGLNCPCVPPVSDTCRPRHCLSLKPSWDLALAKRNENEDPCAFSDATQSSLGRFLRGKTVGHKAVPREEGA